MTYISFSYEIVNDICFLLIYQVIEKKALLRVSKITMKKQKQKLSREIASRMLN